MNADQTAMKHANKLALDLQNMEEQVFFDHYFKTFDVNVDATIFSDRINAWEFEIVLERSANFNVRYSTKDSMVEAFSLDRKDYGYAVLDRKVTNLIRDNFSEHLENYILEVSEKIRIRNGE